METRKHGQKTACAKREVIAVDTNVDSVAKRLVDKDAGYEEVKEALEKKILP
jgi:hypothetical protein